MGLDRNGQIRIPYLCHIQMGLDLGSVSGVCSDQAERRQLSALRGRVLTFTSLKSVKELRS